LAVATELTVTPLAVTLLTPVDGSPETFTQPGTDIADAEKLKLTVCAVAGTIPAHKTSPDNDNRNNRRIKQGFILLIILIFILFNNSSLSAGPSANIFRLPLQPLVETGRALLDAAKNTHREMGQFVLCQINGLSMSHPTARHNSSAGHKAGFINI
jgi:hypothetical protein